jgi:glycosyltransferase involved in cell wall biosynthesis
MTIVLIPAFNAAATLPELLSRLLVLVPSERICVIDDGSTDGTGSAAESVSVRVLRHTSNRGKGAALKTGFQFLRTLVQFDAAVTMDADLQHLPEEVPLFFAARSQRGAQLVIGARQRKNSAMPLHRRASNSITSFLVSARTGQDILDSQSGFRLIGREVIESIELEADGYEMETELLLKAARKGFRIEFVPISTIYGKERSHMTHWFTTKRFLQLLLREY